MSVLDLFDLHGKRALITGGPAGIGKKVALAYVQAGAQVAIAARHSEVLATAAAELTAAGGTVLPICCDVTALRLRGMRQHGGTSAARSTNRNAR